MSKLRLKARVKLLASIFSGTGTNVRRDGLAAYVDLDYASLNETLTFDPTDSIIAIYHPSTAVWEKATVTTLLTVSVSPELQAIAALTGTGILRRLGPVTWTLGDTVSAAEGGTGQSLYTTGDILYASGATALARLAGVATGNALISGGVGTIPAWGKVGLTTHVSGTLAIGNGGTGASSASGTALDNITGFASTGFLTRTGAGMYAFVSTTNGITNSHLAQMAAYTFKGNATGATANATDVDIGALTLKASPVGTDEIMIRDNAASGAWKRAALSSVASAGSVASINGQTGAITLGTITPQVRLSLTTSALMTSSATAQTTVYCVPYGGGLVPLYDGTNMVPTLVSTMSQTTTDTTKSPAAVGASLIYDYWVWDDGGTKRCTRGPARASDTTPPALTYVQGIALNTNAITNGPAAQRGTWVGCARSNASSTIDVKFGSAATGGGEAWFGIANAYNQQPSPWTVIDTTASWNMGTTLRSWNNSTTNRASFLSAGGATPISVLGTARIQSTASQNGRVTIGLNSTSVAATNANTGFVTNGADTTVASTLDDIPPVGWNYVQMLELGSNASQLAVGVNGPVWSKFSGVWMW